MDSTEYKIVKTLEEEVMELESNLKSKKKELEVAEINLRSICTHDYYAEDNGDYHKPGWYYVCSICNHWTNYCPDKVRFN
jgi:hypothetical protein